jgi:hypothetical protein
VVIRQSRTALSSYSSCIDSSCYLFVCYRGEAYPPRNHGVVTGLLTGARVHRLDGAHGSVKLTGLHCVHSVLSEVWLPTCWRGGETNRTRQTSPRHAPHFRKEHLVCWFLLGVAPCPHEHSGEPHLQSSPSASPPL